MYATRLTQQSLQHRSSAAAGTPATQAKQLPAVPVGALKTTPLQNRLVQLVLNEETVETKAADFLKYHGEEAELIIEANNLLHAYSKKTSHENFTNLNDALPDLRDRINQKTDLMAGIIGEYALCGAKAVRKTFLDTVLKKDSTTLGPLFDKLLIQTVTEEEVDDKFKNRFLAYTLQAITFNTGEGRLKELMALLGDREIKIDTLAMGGPKAGQANPDADNPKSEKVNARDKGKDARLLHSVGGNLAEFVKAKQQLPDSREENDQREGIGDMKVFMDRSDELLPIYYGLKKDKENVEAFTSPMFTAIHHELGHLVNALKGKHGKKADKYTGGEGNLSLLTDEEELQNISLDKFSDKAFTDELGLPERIAHGAIGGLDRSSMNSLDESRMSADMRMWDEKTYGKNKTLYSNLLGRIKTIADKYWGKHTNWKFKPKGVKLIEKALEEIGTRSDAMVNQLQQVQQLAITAAGSDSKDRKPAATEFYDTLVDMSIDSPRQINTTMQRLQGVLTTWFSD